MDVLFIRLFWREEQKNYAHVYSVYNLVAAHKNIHFLSKIKWLLNIEILHVSFQLIIYNSVVWHKNILIVLRSLLSVLWEILGQSAVNVLPGLGNMSEKEVLLNGWYLFHFIAFYFHRQKWKTKCVPACYKIHLSLAFMQSHSSKLHPN